MGHIIPKGYKYITAQYFKKSDKQKVKRGYIKFELLEPHVFILPVCVFYYWVQLDDGYLLQALEYQFLSDCDYRR